MVSIEGSDVQELNFSRISSRLAAISTTPASTKPSASMAKLRGGKFGNGNKEYKERDRNKDNYKNKIHTSLVKYLKVEQEEKRNNHVSTSSMVKSAHSVITAIFLTSSLFKCTAKYPKKKKVNPTGVR